MELLQNLISPRARRKKLELAGGDTGGNIISSSPPRLFGIPLEELMSKAPPNATVPAVVSRLCEYIYKYGLDNVGLFRVSGSVRVVERMRLQFELMGDVNLEKENDVAAAAGLLRVFLRDLPDTLVPARLTRTFFSVVQDAELDREAVVTEMKNLLRLLPEENYNLLKYISSLLVVVADNEADNKMSAVSLAILFGPNVFKYELTSGMGGLKDMDSSKDVMHLFISEYNTFFAEDGDLSPKDFWERCKKTPPPRPPPPKVQSLPSFFSKPSEDSSTTLMHSASSSSLDNYPIPSPRKIKNITDYNSSSDVEGRQTLVHPMNHMLPLFSPRDDADHNRAYSPFTLESDAHSIIESPMITARTHELVEKIIVETISEHIFGGLDFNQNSGPQSPKSPQKTSFVDIDQVNGSPVDAPVGQPAGALTSSVGINGTIAVPSSSAMVDGSATNLEDYDTVARNDILVGPKKPQGPPRRTPSHRHRHGFELNESPGVSIRPRSIIISRSSHEIRSLNHSLNHTQGSTDKENEECYPAQFDYEKASSSPPYRSRIVHKNDSRALMTQSPSMQNTPESSSSHHSTSSSGSSMMDKSPGSSIKLFIPPLDLSTLHEHVDGVDPIPMSKDHKDTQMWIMTNQLMALDDATDVAIISPRSNKLKKRIDCADLETPVSVDIEAPMSPSAYYGSGLFRASLNTDIPPSPPIHQDLFKKYSGDDGSHKLRQMTKKIQGLKKKIKSFEDSFEREHGYRPSQGEKSAQPDIKKYISELSKVRKDLKRLKEDTEKGNRSRHNSGASSSGVELSPPVTPSVTMTLEFILKCLREKRQDSGRPDEVTLMSRDQVQEEKLAVQRALLHFEGLHGRPTTREEKDLMRPLYDRYRSVKRMLAKPMSPRNSLELQTVPEDQMIEIPRSFTRDAIRIPTADSEQDDSAIHDFGFVTQDLTVGRELNFHTSLDKGLQQAGGGGKDDRRSEDSRGDVRLHEMSLSELHVEIENSRGQKKRLRRNLREFEEEFFEKNGRKVQKEDRYCLQTDYSDYKKVKARLRLLEALILKHHE